MERKIIYVPSGARMTLVAILLSYGDMKTTLPSKANLPDIHSAKSCWLHTEVNTFGIHMDDVSMILPRKLRDAYCSEVIYLESYRSAKY
jgi:hypothetical protein